MIPARVSALTLGVRDIAAMRDFYAALGWRAEVELDDFVAFRTAGSVLTLYLLDKLASDAGVPAGTDPGMRSNLAVNVERREQVDEAIETVRAAGGRITREPFDTEWGGRTAYFADPEHNYWEVAYVPADTKMAELVERATGGSGR